MATLALAAAGAAIGSTLLPAGVSFLGATLTGAAIGSQIGSLAGSYVDNALFGSSGQSRAVEGPRLSNLQVTASTEGAAIPRLYGRARLGGQVIWATAFEEEVVTSSQSAGGGKGGAFGGGAEVSSTEYRYYGNFAIALCEGPITRVGRVWADGRELDLQSYTWRLHTGSEGDDVDSLIAAREGAGNAPAYRGVAYIVFERMALAEFGNRVPQFSFEVFRNTEASDADIKGLVMIPGSGEFVLATEPVQQVFGEGASSATNVHTLQGATDWDVSVDQMQAALPNAKQISLIVSWFGTDLRAGACQLKPGVEVAGKVTQPISWSVAGQARNGAYEISQIDGRAAYGGTPSDQTVVAAIRDLTARGLKVTMTPFIMMDIPAGNALANPYGGSSQPTYPWRGRITCHPAAGQAGTVDKTAGAATQIAAFVGTATPAHFSLNGDSVVYTGPVEWSYRRMILHQAYLVKAAGGVEAFQIGSELRGLTGVRSNANTFPFVAALMAIAADVKAILPSVKILYAADWSEYFGYQPGDGSGDVYFHLDPLWASSSIDAIGIDAYWPLADWREGRSHLDYAAGYRAIHDLDYLKSNVQGGEGYDWYYASQAHRDAQIRTPITDGAGKPWIYRYKDIKSWWLNPHYNRPGGVESATPTAWVPQSKPFWFMEIGCPAVDKGANQPNVFVDPKSVENALPHYSRGVRDDLVQRRYLQAFRDAFDWTKPGYVAGLNPVSAVNGMRMVDLDHVHIYCWDARPFPAFPFDTLVWGDGANWALGHWLNGRLSSTPLNETVSRILRDYGFEDFEAGGLNGTVPGYVIDRVMPARDALQPLELAYFFDSVETGGKITFRHRGQDGTVDAYGSDDLVERRAGDALITLTRGQETELPASAKLRFMSAEQDYQQAVAEARRLTGASGRVAQADLPIVLDDALSGAIAETWLFETWAARERAEFALPPSALAIEPGDVIAVNTGGRTRTLRVTDVSEHGVREIEARSIDSEVYDRVSSPGRTPAPKPPIQIGSPAVGFLDLPLIDGAISDPQSGYVAALQVPWPGSVAIYSSAQTSGYQLKALVPASATLGATLDPLPPGPEGRVDWGAKVRVKLTRGALASADVITVLGGANTAAIRNAGGAWEVLQFLNAALVDVQTYELTGLLRGQGGTEGAMQAVVAAGATFVVLDSAVTRVPLSLSELNLPFNWRYGPGNRNIGDASYVTAPFAYTGIGLRPLSPAHISGGRTSGDLALTWTRRTRIGGDSWEVSDVPLGEDNERYEVDILHGATAKRTIQTTAPSAIYTAAQQVADFGAVQASISVNVYQISSTFGRGAARSAVI